MLATTTGIVVPTRVGRGQVDLEPRADVGPVRHHEDVGVGQVVGRPGVTEEAHAPSVPGLQGAGVRPCVRVGLEDEDAQSTAVADPCAVACRSRRRAAPRYAAPRSNSALARRPRGHDRDRTPAVGGGGVRVGLQVEHPRGGRGLAEVGPDQRQGVRRPGWRPGAPSGACPVLRPVVVTSSAGSPATSIDRLVRPRLSRSTPRSRAGAVRAKNHAPGRDDATAWSPRCARLAGRNA